MNELINLAITTQGGLSAWRKFSRVTAKTRIGGALWAMKGHGGEIENADVVISLLNQRASHILNDQWHVTYSPERVAIETTGGKLIEELVDPRSSFEGHHWETKWTNLQLAYFTGYATWNYLNSPFQFAQPGFEITEIEPWMEYDEKWRRLAVQWPKHIHTHSREQILYIDNSGFIRRLDYKLEIAGNVACTHYLSGYKDISGIKVATKSSVYFIGADNMPKPPLIVSIEWSDVHFE